MNWVKNLGGGAIRVNRATGRPYICNFSWGDSRLFRNSYRAYWHQHYKKFNMCIRAALLGSQSTSNSFRHAGCTVIPEGRLESLILVICAPTQGTPRYSNYPSSASREQSSTQALSAHWLYQNSMADLSSIRKLIFIVWIVQTKGCCYEPSLRPPVLYINPSARRGYSTVTKR